MEKIKVNDVFHFSYNQAERERNPYSNHCFQGTLIARQTENNKIILVDTYWGLQGDGVTFTPTKAREKGRLTFYTNLGEIESIKDYEVVYYSDKDLYSISEQHSCVPSCVHHFKRKGAERSNEKMLAVVNERIREEKKKIDWAVDSLNRLAVDKSKIEDGDLTVYL